MTDNMTPTPTSASPRAAPADLRAPCGPLVQATLARQPHAFDALVARYFGMIYAIGLAHLDDPDRAQDLAQEVFLRAYLGLDRLQNPDWFPGWITAMARNLAVDWLRSGNLAARLVPMVPLDETHEQIADERTQGAREKMESDETTGELRGALRRLPADQREVILLHFMEGLTQEEIGQRLGVHRSSVSRALARGLRRMRVLLIPALRDAMPRLKAPQSATARTVALIGAAGGLGASQKSALAAAASLGAQAPVAPAAAHSGVAVVIQSTVALMKSGGIVMGSGKGLAAAAAVVCAVGGGMVYMSQDQGASAGTSPSPPTWESMASPSAASSLSAVADPGVRAIMEKIVQAQAGIREYTCTVTNTSVMNDGKLTMTERNWAKPPLFLNIQYNTESPLAAMEGSVMYNYSDGNQLVQHMESGPGAVQAYVELFGKSGRLPAEQLQKMAAQAAQPKAYRYDLQKFRAAGMPADAVFFQDWVRDPFRKADYSTVRLDGETSETWTLSATFEDSDVKGRAVIEIGKSDCVMRSGRFEAPGITNSTVTVRDVRINPSPGTPDSAFVYVPPAGVTVVDNTEAFLKQVR